MWQAANLNRKIIIVLLSFALNSFVHAIDVDDALKYLKDRTLNLKIITRIVNEHGKTIWDTEMSRITISGKSVKVKLSGVNILVITDITPYIRSDKTILLVSQGEVWIGSSESAELNHYSTINSLPVLSGESVLFFPLGMIETMDTKVYNIELEIQVFQQEQVSGE